MRLDLKYVVADIDRHGTRRIYLRMPGYKKVRLQGEPGSPEFAESYANALLAAQPKADTPQPGEPGTLRWLCVEYYSGDDYRALDARTRRVRRQILDKTCRIAGRDGTEVGARLYADMAPQHVKSLRDADPAHPEAGNAIVKALRQVFEWAKGERHHDRNPAREVGYLESNNPDGFHTWTTGEIEQFEARHPIGTKPRLALDLLLYSGVRRSDAVRLGRQMEGPGGWHFVEWKGRGKKKTRKVRVLPILPVLRATIDRSPTGDLTYLVTEFGKPFTSAGFGNWFRRQCIAAGLSHCSAHGLRKAGATAAADNGATVHQLCANFGWLNIKQAQRYTEKANQTRLARESMHLIVPLSDHKSPTEEKA
jgi:integrase